MNTVSFERKEAEFTNKQAFDDWARVYDHEPNPLLALEERFLRRLLPSVKGTDVLDVGCGTGRWLQLLSKDEPHTLTGIDASEQMLSLACRKSIPGVMLHHGRLPSLPVAASSADLALSSFTLSYIEDMHACAEELARVLRPDADLFLTDMHPVTALELGWRRGAGQTEQPHHFRHSIEMIVQAMECRGLQHCGRYEPPFGPSELSLFIDGGKVAEYLIASGKPAISLLHFKKRSHTVKRALSFRAAQVVLGPTESLPLELGVGNGLLSYVQTDSEGSGADYEIDLSGYTCFPGLINPHDHLDFALFPRLGRPPYRNAGEWARDIHREFSDEIGRHKRVPLSTRLWWGALRNLLSGVTSVCHHNPQHETFQQPDFPIRILSDFDWAHSLEFQDDLSERHQHALPSRPFILHAGEGDDDEAQAEFTQLIQMGLIDERTVLVHGLALTKEEIKTLNHQGAAIIRCPSSNLFLFQKTASFFTDRKVCRLAIGSDSPLTAMGDMLDELSFCSDSLGYPDEALFRSCYDGAADVLRLPSQATRLNPGNAADLFAVRSRDLTPEQHLAALTWRDVELVVVGGVVRVVSDELLHRLPEPMRAGLECLLIDGVARWLRAPVRTLFQEAAAFLGETGLSLNGRPLSMMEA